MKVPLVTGDPFASLDMTNPSQYTLRSCTGPPRYGLTATVSTAIQIGLSDPTVQANPAQAYTDVATALRAASPAVVVGTYLSGGHLRAADKMAKYPAECIPTSALPPSALLPVTTPGDDPWVDMANADARMPFAMALANEFGQRKRTLGAKFLFLDNITYGYAKPEWQNTLAFLTDLSKRVRRIGGKLVVNSSMCAWGAIPADIPALAAIIDGMTFEMAFHPVYCRPVLARMQQELSVYKAWMGSAMMIGFYAVKHWGRVTDLDIANEQRFLAGMTMLIRDPGQAMLLARTTFVPRAEWFDWPARFGAPQGPYTVVSTSPIVLKRVFANGEITVNATAASDVATSGSAVTTVLY